MIHELSSIICISEPDVGKHFWCYQDDMLQEHMIRDSDHRVTIIRYVWAVEVEAL